MKTASKKLEEHYKSIIKQAKLFEESKEAPRKLTVNHIKNILDAMEKTKNGSRNSTK